MLEMFAKNLSICESFTLKHIEPIQNLYLDRLF